MWLSSISFLKKLQMVSPTVIFQAGHSQCKPKNSLHHWTCRRHWMSAGNCFITFESGRFRVLCSGKGLLVGKWVGRTLGIQTWVPLGRCFWGLFETQCDSSTMSQISTRHSMSLRNGARNPYVAPKTGREDILWDCTEEQDKGLAAQWSGAGADCLNLAHTVWDLLHPRVGQHNQFTFSPYLIFFLVQSGA